MSLWWHRLEAYLRQKRFGAKTLSKLKKKNERLLITNLIGTLFVTSAPIIIAEKYITPEVIEIFWTSPESTTFFVYASAFMVVLLFGEIASKIIWIRFADTVALVAAPVYQVLIWLLLPITLLVEIFIKIMWWITGGKIDFQWHHVVSEEELNAFIDLSHEWGAVEYAEKRQIKNLLSLPDTDAESVMTPRVNVEFLSLDMTVDEACEFLIQSSHSRLPIYGDTTDDVDYTITFREAFQYQREWLGKSLLGSLDLEKIMKVPVTQPLDDLFEKFQKSHRHIALVVDEHGGTAGVVTMEDVLEEIFGDIKDEKDVEEIYIKRKSNSRIEAVGTALIDDILEEFDLKPEDIELPEEYSGEPLSYIIIAEEEEFPTVGTEVVFWEGIKLHLKVLTLDDTVIEKVECWKA